MFQALRRLAQNREAARKSRMRKKVRPVLIELFDYHNRLNLVKTMKKYVVATKLFLIGTTTIACFVSRFKNPPKVKHYLWTKLYSMWFHFAHLSTPLK